MQGSPSPHLSQVKLDSLGEVPVLELGRRHLGPDAGDALANGAELAVPNVTIEMARDVTNGAGSGSQTSTTVTLPLGNVGCEEAGVLALTEALVNHDVIAGKDPNEEAEKSRAMGSTPRMARTEHLNILT